MVMCESCKCYEVEAAIKREFPKADWNCDEACSAWGKQSPELLDNHIEFADGDDENWACTCPTCGRIICGWCI